MRDSGSITRCIGRPPQRGIAGQDAGEGMAGEDAGQQAAPRCRNCRARARRRARGRRPRRNRGPARGRPRARASPRPPAPAAPRRWPARPRPRAGRCTVVSPSARAPNIRARWETDLSPGARTRPCRRPTGRATSLAEWARSDRAASRKGGRNATPRSRTMEEFGFDRVKDA